MPSSMASVHGEAVSFMPRLLGRSGCERTRATPWACGEKGAQGFGGETGGTGEDDPYGSSVDECMVDCGLSCHERV